MNPSGPPVCTKCSTPIPTDAYNLDQFTKCSGCRSRFLVKVFAALTRPVSNADQKTTAVVSGESSCFYHENKVAVVVCDSCGRVLCALCDCEINGQHMCPSCLTSGKNKSAIEPLESTRTLYAPQALLAAMVPLFFTGLIALFYVWKYWNSPPSLVKPQRWMMPAALVLAIIQTIAFLLLFIFIAFENK